MVRFSSAGVSRFILTVRLLAFCVCQARLLCAGFGMGGDDGVGAVDEGSIAESLLLRSLLDSSTSLVHRQVIESVRFGAAYKTGNPAELLWTILRNARSYAFFMLHVSVHSFRLLLPCASGTCHLVCAGVWC
jgi:hypothetical protein